MMLCSVAEPHVRCQIFHISLLLSLLSDILVAVFIYAGASLSLGRCLRNSPPPSSLCVFWWSSGRRWVSPTQPTHRSSGVGGLAWEWGWSFAGKPNSMRSISTAGVRICYVTKIRENRQWRMRESWEVILYTDVYTKLRFVSYSTAGKECLRLWRRICTVAAHHWLPWFSLKGHLVDLLLCVVLVQGNLHPIRYLLKYD